MKHKAPKVVDELRGQVRGELYTASHVLDYFSTDGSIFTRRPQIVFYPKDTADVANAVKVLHAEAEAGRPMPITARGKGTDQSGGALGEGIMVVFPAHMNKLVKLEKDTATVQPGLLYATFQKALHTHNRFLPPYPSSINFCSIGGAVANNACGEKTIKYGATRDYVKNLQFVLSNGDVIETKRLSAKELTKKKKLNSLEGHIYRQLDGLITDNKDLIAKHHPKTSKNAAGYNLWDIKHSDGSFDLGQLLVGSQGTLGIVTEATIKTEPYNPRTTLLVGYFDSIEKAGEAVTKIMPMQPSALEIVDYYLLDFLRENQPQMIEGLVPEQLPKIVLLIEFDNPSQFQQGLRRQRGERVLRKLASSYRITTKPHEQEALWQIRHSAAAVIWMTKGKQKALPIIEDGVVPVEKLPQFLTKAYKLLQKYNLEIAVWGHAGNANFHMQPFMDLSKATDRKKALDLADEFYDMVIKMGGSTCGEHNDGLMRSRFLKRLYGDEMFELFTQVRLMFDPHDIFNPGIKTDMGREEVAKLIKQERHEYAMVHLYDHMPHN
jgi:FAD/FMN-containing dehydrogenase